MEKKTEAIAKSYGVKKKLTKFLKKYEWSLLLGLTGLSWVLGFIGFVIYFRGEGLSQSFTDIAYVTFQLFTFESGFVDGSAPLVLDIARFLAPFSLVVAAFIAFMWVIGDKYKLLKLKWYRNHTVIIGLGKSGKELLKNLQKQDEKIVVVTKEELAAADKSDHLKTVFIAKDSKDNEVLEEVRLTHAKHVMCMANDVQQNLSTGNFIGTYLNLYAQNSEVKMFIQTTPFFMEQLQELDFDDKASENYNMFGHRINFFSIYERSARLLAKEYSPDKFAAVDFAKDSKMQAHILIAGFGAMGQALLLQAGKIFHFANRNKLKATVLHNNIDEVERFKNIYPGAQNVIDLQFIEMSEINKRNVVEKTKGSKIHVAFICAPDDSIALDAYNKISTLDAKIVFCHEYSDGFSKEIKGNNVAHFDIEKETLTANAIVKEDVDKEAVVVHESYMFEENSNAEQKYKLLKKLTHQDWNNLTERTKNANRNQADHILTKLRIAGLTAVEDKNIDTNNLYNFSKDEDKDLVELLAEIEHRRWNAEQLLNGWIFGEKRDNQLKIHDNIVPYSKLTERVKQYDRDAVINMPVILAAVEMKINNKV